MKDEYDDDEKAEAAEDVHGKDGLSTKEGEAFPTDVPLKAITTSPIVTMYEKIKNYPEKIHLVATGALTNVALLLKVFPDVVDNIEQIVFMGGAINYGNITPSAEANMRFDPEAAALVLKTKVKIVMVPLEVTHQAWVTDEILNKIKEMNTRFTKILHGMLLFYREAYHKIYNFDYSPLHDPCAIAYVIDASLFCEQHIRVDIETTGLSRGRTVCDLYNLTGKKNNVYACKKIEVPKFWELMFNSLE